MTKRLLLALLLLSFGGFAVAVALGLAASPDGSVAVFMARLWDPALKPLFWGVAALGGIEITSGSAALLLLRLVQTRGWRAGLALLTFPLAVSVEIALKHWFDHPGLPPGINHGDLPSVSSILERAGGAFVSSFPSGHVARAVLVYGLAAFLAWPSRWRWPATFAAGTVIILLTVDRLYLGVHWYSDVVGGLLLGAGCLIAAMIWLDHTSRVDVYREVIDPHEGPGGGDSPRLVLPRPGGGERGEAGRAAGDRRHPG